MKTRAEMKSIDREFRFVRFVRVLISTDLCDAGVMHRDSQLVLWRIDSERRGCRIIAALKRDNRNEAQYERFKSLPSIFIPPRWRFDWKNRRKLQVGRYHRGKVLRRVYEGQWASPSKLEGSS
jgi:hypothetical protein